MLVVWLDIFNQFWFEYDLVVYLHTCCISTYIRWYLTFQVSQGSVATDLRWGENFNTFLFHNSLLYIAVIEKNKSVSFSYGLQSSSRNEQIAALGEAETAAGMLTRPGKSEAKASCYEAEAQ